MPASQKPARSFPRNASPAAQVRLSLSEMARAASIGVQRHLKSLERGSEPAHGASQETLWQIHIEGALGECAVAKARNVYWSGSVDTFRSEGDIGSYGSYEVRTASSDTYRLIVRPDDRDERPFIFVTGLYGWYTIHGWIMGKDAKRPEWLEEPGHRPPAYFVPTVALFPLATLPPPTASTVASVARKGP